ncbi:MAG: amino acid transporter [Chromatiales bacterium 21-64-14]|nr:MAG: amino acid transporter [Chromatiales bacterium 21-64-14]HQU14862.1 NAAT family transporter [Gammaproteobacteria bacterium]
MHGFSVDWTYTARSLVALIAILNPVGAVPVFMSVTASQSAAERTRTARVVAQSVAVVLLISAFFGEPILAFFSISMAAFRVGAGLLILLMAIAMLHARAFGVRQTPEELEEGVQKEAVAVVPLGIPLLAGPGAISTVILHAQRAHGALELGLLSGVILLTALLTYVVLRLADPVARRMGVAGINIATRVSGLLLAAIAVEILAAGLLQLFPGLAGVGH